MICKKLEDAVYEVSKNSDVDLEHIYLINKHYWSHLEKSIKKVKMPFVYVDKLMMYRVSIIKTQRLLENYTVEDLIYRESGVSLSGRDKKKGEKKYKIFLKNHLLFLKRSYKKINKYFANYYRLRELKDQYYKQLNDDSTGDT